MLDQDGKLEESGAAFSAASLEQMEIEVAAPGEPGLLGDRVRLRPTPPTQEKRVSKVFPIFDWPRGTRKRKWGILHDQIWFYDEPKSGTSFEGWVFPSDELPPTRAIAPNGHAQWWRRDEGRWLRLYMDRRMLWLGILKFRIHAFHSGDDDSAPHDHPWGFVTLPLRDYYETVSLRYRDGARGFTEYRTVRCVRRWRLHFRSALYRHFVHEPERPFTTLVVTWGRDRRWGFWPDPETFVPYDEWT